MAAVAKGSVHFWLLASSLSELGARFFRASVDNGVVGIWSLEASGE